MQRLGNAPFAGYPEGGVAILRTIKTAILRNGFMNSPIFAEKAIKKKNRDGGSRFFTEENKGAMGFNGGNNGSHNKGIRW